MHVDTCTTLFIYAHGSNLTNKMKINTNKVILMISVCLALLIIGVGNLNGITYAQTDSSSNNGSTGDASTISTNIILHLTQYLLHNLSMIQE